MKRLSRFDSPSKGTDKVAQRRKLRRVLRRNDYVAALRDGRRERAATFVDRKKEQSRRACRGEGAAYD